MSMPWYSCMESALTTSPPSDRASRNDSPDFPAAVGPTTAITGGMASVWQPGTHARHGARLAAPVPGRHQVADLIPRRRAAQAAAELFAVGRPGQHLPGRAARDHELVVERGGKPGQPRR